MDTSPHAPGIRILVVDDNADSADSLARLLVLLRHDAKSVHCGAQAIELARSWKPDVVLVDLHLPDMSGYEVATAIRAEAWREIVVVAVTGWMRDRNDERLRQAGFDGYLTKPVPIAELMRFFPKLATDGLNNSGITSPVTSVE